MIHIFTDISLILTVLGFGIETLGASHKISLNMGSEDSRLRRYSFGSIREYLDVYVLNNDT